MPYSAGDSNYGDKYDKRTSSEGNIYSRTQAGHHRKHKLCKRPPNGVNKISVEMRSYPAPRLGRGPRRIGVPRYSSGRITTSDAQCQVTIKSAETIWEEVVYP